MRVTELFEDYIFGLFWNLYLLMALECKMEECDSTFYC